MTIDKFYETLQLVVELDGELHLQTTLEQIRENLSNLVSSPATPQYQTALATNLASFQANAAQLGSGFSPGQRSSLGEIGGSEYFDPSIAAQVSEVIALNAMTPSVARDFVTELASRRANFMATVRETLDGLNKLGVGSHKRTSGVADLAFLIPRALFDNRLEAFAKELKFISHLMEHFSEAVTGHVEPVNLETLSSSVPTIAIAASLGVITAIGAAVNKFLDAWIKVEKIRRLRGELIEVGIRKDAAEQLTEEITTTVEKVVEECTTFTLSNYKADGGRKNELDTAIRQDLHRLFGQIERGLTIEIRTPPDEEVEPSEVDAVKAITDISRKLSFPPVANEPVLLSPGEVIEGNIATGKVAKTTTTKTTHKTVRGKPARPESITGSSGA
jgi:hypothetical protein